MAPVADQASVEILEGLRPADGGRVLVCGLDPQSSGDAFKQKIGAVLQSTALPDKIRVEEALSVFASFYSHRRAVSEQAQVAYPATEEKRPRPLLPSSPAAETAAGPGGVTGQSSPAVHFSR